MNVGVSWMGRAYKSIYDEFIRHDVTYRKVLDDHRLLDGTCSVLSIGAGEGQLEVQLARECGVCLGYIDRAESVLQAFDLRAKEGRIDHLIIEKYLGSFEVFSTACSLIASVISTCLPVIVKSKINLLHKNILIVNIFFDLRIICLVVLRRYYACADGESQGIFDAYIQIFNIGFRYQYDEAGKRRR